ncbi:hypothetical protein BDQ17DRAFT_1425358 [Cyathus striatus]|nr:hypothetical protein BDQ17DRAFT_1425358 [Cyathus striatus]
MPSGNTSAPAYPPKAASRAGRDWNVVDKQPRPTTGMVVSRSKPDDGQDANANRLRGGCVPCPDGGFCFCIPIPCCC